MNFVLDSPNHAQQLHANLDLDVMKVLLQDSHSVKTKEIILVTTSDVKLATIVRLTPQLVYQDASRILLSFSIVTMLNALLITDAKINQDQLLLLNAFLIQLHAQAMIADHFPSAGIIPMLVEPTA